MTNRFPLSKVSRIHGGGRLGLTGKDFEGSGVPAYGAGGKNGYVATAEYDRPAVILSSIGARCGKCFHVQGPWTSLANTQVILPDPDVLDSRYLWHQLNDERRWPRSGTGQPFIKPSDVKSHMISVPSLEEQRHIATFLDQADALRDKRRQVLAHLDALIQSTFHDLFGHLEPDTTVAEVSVKVRTGPFGSQLLHSEFIDEGISVLGLDNVVGNKFTWGQRRYITREKYEQLKRYTVTPGDVLISIMGTTGRCVVLPAEIPTAINTKHICAITPDKELIDSTFLWAAFLWHPSARAHLRRQTKGSIMEGLNAGIIKALPIPVPAFPDQLVFAEKVEQIVAQRRLTERVTDFDKALFLSLQSRAFRGEL